MLTTRARQLGNSVVIPLPVVKDGVKLEPNQEYIVVYSNNGTITLVPKISDPFSGGDIAEFYETDTWDYLIPEGRESF